VLVGAVNELVDADLDAATKPWKPIPAGLVSRRGAGLMALAGAGAMVGFGAGFGPLALALLLLGTGLGLVYDLWLKRTAFSWLPYVLALPLLPLWVWTALAGFEPRLLLLYPLGAPAVVGIHLAQALPDVAGDRAAGVRHPASLLGERRAIVACWAATLLAPAGALVALALAPSVAERPAVVIAAASLVLVLVLVDAWLYQRRPRLGVMACFPCVAVGTVALGLAWVVAVAL
jgi:4-hydroxybenzoate polyprenyltransferase